MPITRNQASSTNEGEEDTLQRLLHTVASLQARSDEQSRLSTEAERRYRQAEERHTEALRRAQEREEELQRQLEAVKTAHGGESSMQKESTPKSSGGNLSVKKLTKLRSHQILGKWWWNLLTERKTLMLICKLSKRKWTLRV
ncbi:hypothetical protein CR513_51099, partial [Mucuna pruriens]